jgi:hypothetical protein
VRHEAAEALGGIASDGAEDEASRREADLPPGGVLQVLREWAVKEDAPVVVRESCQVAIDMWEVSNPVSSSRHFPCHHAPYLIILISCHNHRRVPSFINDTTRIAPSATSWQRMCQAADVPRSTKTRRISSTPSTASERPTRREWNGPPPPPSQRVCRRRRWRLLVHSRRSRGGEPSWTRTSRGRQLAVSDCSCIRHPAAAPAPQSALRVRSEHHHQRSQQSPMSYIGTVPLTINHTVDCGLYTMHMMLRPRRFSVPTCYYHIAIPLMLSQLLRISHDPLLSPRVTRRDSAAPPQGLSTSSPRLSSQATPPPPWHFGSCPLATRQTPRATRSGRDVSDVDSA